MEFAPTADSRYRLLQGTSSAGFGSYGSTRQFLHLLPAIALVLIVLAASGTSLGNGFAYDDLLIIRDNQQIHRLADMAFDFVQGYWPQEHGGALYRPLTLVLFSLQWAAGRGAPWVFHAVNVTLYAALTLGLFGLGRRILPTGAAWLGRARFALHPVHVEAVANVVGQGELTTALLVVLALQVYLDART